MPQEIQQYDSVSQFDPNAQDQSADDLDVRIKTVDSFDTSVFDTQTQLGFHDQDSETIQAYTLNGFQTNTLMPVTYGKSYSFSQVISAATESLGLRYEDYSILLVFSDDDMRWFDHTKYLEDYSVFNGMKFCIFPTEYQIKVESTVFNNTNQYIIGITDTVETIVKKIAQVENIENPSDFTLFREEEKDKDGKKKKTLRPLSLFQDLPHQCDDFKSLVLKRRFFIFSAADLVSPASILMAFDDAFDEIRTNKKIYMSEDTAVELTAYAYVVDHPELRLDSDNPPETKKHRPYQYKNGKNFNKQVYDFLSSRGLPDTNNAARLFIRIARTLPGFGMIRFKCFIEVDKVETRCECLCTPHDFLIYNEEARKTYYRIPYHSIVNLTNEEDVVTVNYSLQRNVGSVNIRAGHSEEIYDVIQSFHTIQRNLLLERARLRLEGKWRGPVSEMDRLKLDTYNSISDKEPKQIEYDKSFTGKMVLQLAMKELRLPVEKIDDYAVLCQIHTNRKWLNNDVTVGQLGVFEGSKLYILTKKVKINVKFGEQDEKLFLDLTEPCQSVVTDIFKQVNQPYVHGYALFHHKNNEMEPLDYKYSIPEQTLHFQTLYLKRRFFMLSKDDFASVQLSKIGYADSHDYFLNAQCQATDSVLQELTTLSLLIDGKDDAYVQSKDFQLEKWVPSSYKMNKAFKQKFIKEFPSYPRQEKEINYIRKYMKIVRDVPYFGAEMQNVKYRVIDLKNKKKGKDLNGEFRYCPLLVYLMDDNGKQVYKIPWTLVIRTKIMKDSIHFTFCDSTHHTSKENVVTLEIRTKDMQRFQTMVDGSLNIYQQMLKERQRELQRQRAETAQKLAGGWQDQYGVIHGPMIDLMISPDLGGYKKSKLTFWIDLAATGDELVDQMSRYFKIDQKPNQVYSVVIISPDGNFSWVGPKESLLDISPTRKSHLVILNTTPLMKITSASNISKTIKLDITQPLKDLLKNIAGKYGISNFLGYTLFTPNSQNNGELVPLELVKSIPEQTYNFDDIVFRRRFYMISRADFLDNRALWQTYSDIVELVLSGSMDLTNEQVAELAYYQLIAEKNEKLEAKNIPDDLNKYVPKNMKLARTMAKDLKNYCKVMPIEDPNDARRKYIALARSIETFGSEIYQVQYFDNVKGKVVAKDCLLYVTPYKIYTVDLQTKKKLMCFEYCNLLDVNQVDDMLSLTHCTNNGHRLFDLFKSPQAALIKQIITSYIHIGIEILNNAIAEGLDVEEVATCYRITVNASYVLAEKNISQSIALDSRLNGKQVSARVSKLMGLHPRGEYACMLNFTPQDHKWCLDNELIGNLRPYENISMSVFNRYMKIKISLDGVNYTYPAVDVTKTIRELIPRLAAHFDIEMPVGYSIIRADNNEPLDLRYTIPEQAPIFDSFIFRRIYFITSKYDMQNDFIVTKLAEDFKMSALNGGAIISETEMLELAVYDVFMHSDNPESVKKMVFNSLDGFLPTGMQSKPQYITKLNNILATTPAMSSGNAARQYILQVSKLNGFDRQVFNAKVIDDEKKEELPVHLTVSSTQLKVTYDTTSRETISVSMKHVLNCQSIQDDLRIRIESDEGDSTVMKIRTQEAEQIEKKITQIIKCVVPDLKAREQVMKTCFYNTNNIPHEAGEVPIIFASRFNERRPRVIMINPNKTAAQAVELLQQHFFIKDPSYRIGFFASDYSFGFLGDAMPLKNIYTRPDIVLYFMKPSTESYIESALNFITKHKIQIDDPINTICQTILGQLGMGVEDGYTLYTPDFTPLDIALSLPYQTDMIWDLYLRRRFYVFTYQFFDKPENISSLYDDCKLAVTSGSIPTTEDLAAYLGIYSVYAQIASVSDFNAHLEKFGTASVLPIAFQNSENAIKKVDTISRSIVPISAPDAQAKYIAEVCQLRGFGAEYHDVEFKTAFKDWRPGVLSLSPFFIQVETGGKIVDTIDYTKIIHYYPDETGCIILRYYNDNNFINFIQIRSPHTNQIFTYINTLAHFMNQYGHLLSIDEIRAILLKLKNNPNGDLGYGQDYDPGLFQFDNMDLTSFDTDNLKIEDINLDYLEKNRDYDDYTFGGNDVQVQFDLHDAPDAVMAAYNDPSNWWKANQLGHSINKSKNAMENIERCLRQIMDDFNKMTPEQFNARLNAIDDMMALINPDDLGEDFKAEYAKLKELIKGLRDLGRMIEQSDQELYRYQGQIEDMIKDALGHCPNLKKLIDLRAQQVAKENQTPLTPVSRSLIALTDLQDKLTCDLLRNLDKLKGLGFDTRALIRNLQNSADTLTRLAANFTDATDPKVLDQHIIPQLEQLGNLMALLQQLIEKANVDDPQLRELLATLAGGREAVEASLVDFSNRSKLAAGDQNATLLNNRKAVNATLLNLIKAKKYIDENLGKMPADLKKEAQDLSQTLANAALALAIDPNNTLPSHQAMDALRLLLGKLNGKKSPTLKGTISDLGMFLDELEAALRATSFINIIPANVDKVVDDAMIMIRRFSALNTEEWASRDKPGLASTEKAVTDLKTNVDLIENHIKELRKNMVNGAAQRQMQVDLLRLANELPNMQQAVELIFKNTNDNSFQVILERLITDLDAALYDMPPNEDIGRCAHIEKYHKAMTAVANIMNTSHRTMQLEAMKKHPATIAKLDTILEKVADFYTNLVRDRAELHEHPFAKETINEAIQDLEKVSKVMNLLRLPATEVSEITHNNELDNGITDAVKAINIAVAALRDAPLNVYRLPPTAQAIKNVKDQTNQYIKQLEALAKQDAIANNKSHADKVNKELEYMKKKLAQMNQLKPYDIQQLYNILEKMLQHAERLPSKLSNLPSTPGPSPEAIAKPEVAALRNVLKVTIPTPEHATREILECIDPTDNLIKALENLKKDKDVAKNKEMMAALDAWIKALKAGENMLRSVPKSGNTVQSLKALLPQLVGLNNDVQNVPSVIRKELDQKLMDKLLDTLGLANAKLSQAVTCVRNLPTKGTVNADINLFRRFDNDNELDEAIPEMAQQFSDISQLIKSIAEIPQLGNRPNTKMLIDEMAALLNQLSIDVNSAKADEKKLLPVLNNSRDRLAQVAANSELVSPIVGVPKLPEIAKNVSTNSQTISRLLEKPHFNAQKTKEFTALIEPLLKKLAEALNNQWYLQNANTPALAPMKELPSNTQGWLNNIKGAKPGAAQRICDDIHTTLSNLIGLIMEYPELNDIANAIFNILDATGKYTSTSKGSGFSTQLYPKTRVVPPEILSQALGLLSEFLAGNTSNLPPNVLAALEDVLMSIADKAEMLQPFVKYAAQLLAPQVASGDPVTAARAALIAALTSDNPEARAALIEDLAVRNYVRTANALNNLATEVESLNGNYPEEVDYRLSALKHAIAVADTKLLVKCGSISAAIILLDPLHNVQQAARLLIQSAGRAKLDNEFSNLPAALNDYETWLYESDMALTNLFNGQVDSLLVNLEQAMSDDTAHALPKTAQKFVRDMVVPLKRKERLMTIKWEDMANEAKTYLQFTTDTLPAIKSSSVVSNGRENVIAIADAINKINPAIRMWSAMANKIDEPKFRCQTEADLGNYVANGNRLNNLATNPGVFATEEGRLETCIHDAMWAHSLAKFEPKTKDKVDNVNRLVNSLNKSMASSPLVTKQMLGMLLDKLGEMLNEIVKTYPIDFSKQFMDDTAKEFDMDLITDKECLAAAKVIKAELERSKKHVDATKNEKQVKKQDGAQVIPRSVLNVNTADEEKPSGRAALENLAAETFYQFELQTRLAELQQLLLQLYPDLIKFLENPQQVQAALSQLDAGDLERTANEINNMLGLLNDPQKFDKYAKGLSQEQVFNELLLLRHYSDALQKQPVRNAYNTAEIMKWVQENPASEADPARAIQKMSAVEQLLQTLMALKFAAATNNPKAAKFARTEEGQNVLRQNIPQHDLIQQQQSITQQLGFINLPESLKLIHSQMSPEEILNQARIINSAIDTLTKNADKINPENLTQQELLKELFAQQIQQAKENPSTFGNHYVDQELTENALTFLDNTQDKLAIMRAIHAMANPYTGVPNKPGKPVLTKTLDTVANQVNNPTNELPKLNGAEQEAVQYAMAVLSSPEFLKFAPKRNESVSSANATTITSLANQLTPASGNDLFVAPAAAGVNNSYEKNDMVTNALQFATLLNNIKKALNAVAPGVKPAAKDAHKARVIEEIENFKNTPLKDYNAKIKAMKPDEQSTLLAVIDGTLATLNDANVKLNGSDFRNFIFDKAALLAMQQKGTPDPLSAAKIEELSQQAAKRRKEVDMGLKLSNLIIKRGKITDVPPATTVGKDAMKASMDEVLKQLEMSFNALNGHLGRFNDDELANQQAVLLSTGILQHSVNFDTIQQLADAQLQNQLLRGSSNQVLNSIKFMEEQQNLLEKLLNIAKKINAIIKDAKAGQYSLQEYAQAQDAIATMCGISDEQLDLFIASQKKEQLICQAGQIAEIIAMLNNCAKQPITDFLVNIPEFDLSVRANNETPSNHQLATAESNLFAAILRLLPSMSMVPIAECKNILATETQTAGVLLSRLLNHKGTSYPIDASTLLQFMPQLCAAAIRVIPSLPEPVRKLIGASATDLAISAAKISTTGANLADPKASQEFYKNVEKLLTAIRALNAICSEQGIELKSIDALANVKRSIDTKDVDDIAMSLVDTHAINAANTASNTKDAPLDALKQPLADVEGPTFEIQSRQVTITPELDNKLTALKPKLIEVISAHTPDPIKEINSIQNIRTARDGLLDKRAKFQTGVNSFVRSVSRKDRKLVKNAITDILTTVSTGESMAARSLIVTNAANPGNFSDLVSKFAMSVSSLKAIEDLSTDTSANSTTVRRTTRSLNRMIDSLIDMLEDAETPQWTEKPTKPIDCAKLEVLKALVGTIQVLMGAVAAHSSAKIPETFAESLKKCLPQLKSALEGVKKSSQAIEPINTDKNAYIAFSKDVNDFIASNDELSNNLSDITLQNLLNGLTKIASASHATMASLNRLTDVEIEEPDLEAADLLPQHFTMPPVPSNITQSLAEQAQALAKAAADVKNFEKTFFTNAAAKDNKKTANSLVEYTKSMKAAIERILAASATTMTLSHQTALTNSASSLVNSMDSLVTALRNRFLLRGDWKNSSEEAKQTLGTELDNAVKLANEAVEIARREEAANDAYTKKLRAALKPLQTASSKVESQLQAAQELPTSMSREWALQILSLGSALAKATTKILLHSKEHPSANSNAHADMGENVTAELGKLSQAVEKILGGAEEPEAIVMTVMDALGAICAKFTKGSGIEDQGLLEAFNIVAKTSRNVKDTAEGILSQKRAAKEKSTARAGEIQARKQSKPVLLKRLDLEARVIRARTILERYEAAVNAMQ